MQIATSGVNFELRVTWQKKDTNKVCTHKIDILVCKNLNSLNLKWNPNRNFKQYSKLK